MELCLDRSLSYAERVGGLFRAEVQQDPQSKDFTLSFGELTDQLEEAWIQPSLRMYHGRPLQMSGTVAAPHGDAMVEGGSDDPCGWVGVSAHHFPPEEGLFVGGSNGVLGTFELAAPGKENGSKYRVLRCLVEPGELLGRGGGPHISITQGTTIRLTRPRLAEPLSRLVRERRSPQGPAPRPTWAAEDSRWRTVEVIGPAWSGRMCYGMRMNRSRYLGVLLALSCLFAFRSPASADSGAWPDPRDGRGPLAIRKIDIGHVRWDDTTVEVTFERRVDPARLGKKDFFLVDFDEDGDRKSEYWVYFVPGPRGNWRSFTYYPRSGGIAYGTHPFKRTSPSSIEIKSWRSYEQYRSGGYLFRVASYSKGSASCSEGCWDAVPNSRWLVHDWTPPRLLRFNVPEFSLEPADPPSVPVTWRVVDKGFSGLAENTLWKRLAGSGDWVEVVSKRSSRVESTRVEAEQGQKIDLRVTARDGAGNRIPSTQVPPARLQTVVPFDDSNTAHAATYVGIWEEQERSEAYLEGVHVSTTSLDSFRFLGEGTRYCVSYLPGDEFGRARFEVAGERIDFDLSVRNPYGGRTWCVEHESRSERTAVLTVQSGVINVDAFWFE